MRGRLEQLYVVAFTHKKTALSDIGLLHVNDDEQQEFLSNLKTSCNLGELMYLSTCNRVEFVFTCNEIVNEKFLRSFFKAFPFAANDTLLNLMCDCAEIYSGINAVTHLFNVASSLDSMVVGEREIIGQVRKSYHASHLFGLTGDLIRLVIKCTIATGKQIYTETQIASKPVSIVSLAYQQLQQQNVPNDARILIVGAGITNTNMTRFLRKHGFTNFSVFNRSLKNADNLAQLIRGSAHSLNNLKDYHSGFDVIITCTGSDSQIITPDIYASLIGEDTQRKVVVDLAIPNDFEKSICDEFAVKLISIEELKNAAAQNIEIRKTELVRCNQLISENLDLFKEMYHERNVEIAMSSIPEKVKKIKKLAINEVFAKEISGLDDSTKELFDKVLTYMEKKYISVPMKMAKEIILEKKFKN